MTDEEKQKLFPHPFKIWKRNTGTSEAPVWEFAVSERFPQADGPVPLPLAPAGRFHSAVDEVGREIAGVNWTTVPNGLTFVLVTAMVHSLDTGNPVWTTSCEFTPTLATASPLRVTKNANGEVTMIQWAFMAGTIQADEVTQMMFEDIYAGPVPGQYLTVSDLTFEAKWNGAHPFQVVVQKEEDVWKWTVKDYGIAAAAVAGYIIPRAGAPVSVASPAPVPATANDYIYLQIPLTETGDFNAASAAIVASAVALDEFPAGTNRTRNIQLAQLVMGPGDVPDVMTSRQAWTAGDVCADRLGVEGLHVDPFDASTESDETVFDKVVADAAYKTFKQDKYKQRLSVDAATNTVRVKRVALDGSPVTFCAVDQTGVTAYGAVSEDGATHQLLQSKFTLKIDLVDVNGTPTLKIVQESAGYETVTTGVVVPAPPANDTKKYYLRKTDAGMAWFEAGSC